MKSGPKGEVRPVLEDPGIDLRLCMTRHDKDDTGANRKLARVRLRAGFDQLVRVVLRFCAGTVALTTLFPYVSPVLITSMDVQLMALVAALATLFALVFVAPHLFGFCWTDLHLLALGILTLIYVDPSVQSADPQVAIRACAPVLLGFPIYLAVRVLFRYMHPGLLVLTVAIYLAAILLQMKFPDGYTFLSSHLISEARFAPEEGRGPNGLTPERSMMGNMSILFALSILFFHRRYWQSHRVAKYFVVLGSILMLFMTKSATGVVLALLVALTGTLESRLRKIHKIAVLSCVAGGIFILGQSLNLSEARGSVALSAISSNPLTILQDYSFATRTTNIFVGLDELSEVPFGTGDVRPNLDLATDAFGGDLAGRIWPDATFRSYMTDVVASRDNISGVGGMIQRMGFLGVIVGLYPIFLIRGFRGMWAVRVYAMGLLFNASMFIPTLWFMVGCSTELRNLARSGLDPDSPFGFPSRPDAGSADVRNGRP